MSRTPLLSFRLGGPLGAALDVNLSAHLRTFVRDEQSPAIALFCADHRAHNHEGDWYGEHAGKWLCAAALAVERTGDPELSANLKRVAEHLLGRQEEDGYLGTYPPERRFMCRRAPAPPTWDGAPQPRTWDVWVHSYMILGLLAAGRALKHSGCIQAAERIGDLFWRTLTEQNISLVSLGNHHGLSALVLLDPVVELYFATGRQRFLDLAQLILAQANDAPLLRLQPQALAGIDAAFIATGKAYQLIWMLASLAKLHRASGDPALLDATLRLWKSIHEHHLTLGGGPWGGVAHRSREVFNPPGVFSPQGYVETCSTFAWIQLNRELLLQTGEARFAEAIEQSAYNDLLGAQAPTGDNWCYYSFPNGRRIHTTYWRCCKSSGPWALEELASVACTSDQDGNVSLNLHGSGEYTVNSPLAGRVRLHESTRYPFDGAIRVSISPEKPAQFSLRVRIPSWTEAATVRINGEPGPTSPAGTYAVLRREWRDGDVVELNFPMRPSVHRATNRNVQESRAPDGSLVAQEVLRFEYAAITRGPLVYSTNLIDGFKFEETVRLPHSDPSEWLRSGDPLPGSDAPTVQLVLGYRPPLLFTPYFEAGGRADGTWRITWLSLAPTQ